jgi:hypothetical protein
MGSKSGTKGTRELTDFSILLIMMLIAVTLPVVGVKGGCMVVCYEA